MQSFPSIAHLGNWKNLLILADDHYLAFIRDHVKLLRKNGNRIIIIAPFCETLDNDPAFDDVLSFEDNIDLIIGKIGKYLVGATEEKSGNHLSQRETEILKMVANGFSNKEIADQSFISIHTVITHRKNITSKLGIKSISGLTLYAALNDLIDFPR